MMIVQHHEAAYWTRKCIDCFEPYKEGAERPKIMAIAIHPYITAAFPHQYLEDVYRAIATHNGRAALERRANPRLVPEGEEGSEQGGRESLRVIDWPQLWRACSDHVHAGFALRLVVYCAQARSA